ncbi:MAG: AAA family ATPase [Agathobacter sp.]|nr:AAA family ATPase [Agathobacter sp.]
MKCKMENKGIEMKKLIVIVGPNAVGKTTTAKCLVEKLPKTAYVDSDWCRFMNPFPFSEITKQTVTKNIYDLLHNFLNCEVLENVVFTYSWHGERKEIYNNIICKLKDTGAQFEEKIVVLKCSEEENRSRAKRDGRDIVRIERGMENTLSFYDRYAYPSVDTTHMTPEEVAEEIIKRL